MLFVSMSQCGADDVLLALFRNRALPAKKNVQHDKLRGLKCQTMRGNMKGENSRF